MWERKLISNKHLTEWLLFCLKHVGFAYLPGVVDSNLPRGPVLRGKVHDERPRVAHQRAH